MHRVSGFIVLSLGYRSNDWNSGILGINDEDLKIVQVTLKP